MTGWRLGFAIWPKSVYPLAEKLCVNDHSCVNASAQYAGIAALQGPQDADDTMCKAVDERRRVIVSGLNQIPGITCVEPGGAIYAFPNITGTGMTSQQLQAKLLEQAGIAVVSGTSFGAFGEGYLRFSYANSTDNIREALGRIRACLA